MSISHRHLFVTAGALALGLAAGSYAGTAKREYNLIPAGTAKFAPIDPKAPQGIQLAVVAGDVKTGPVGLLLKLPKGDEGLHWHTSSYYAVTVEGTTKHWLKGKEAEARANPPGTSWFQPGGSAATAHGDECVSDSCTIFVFMDKGLDFMPAK